MKWLSTLELLETDGRIRQKHMLPLNLMEEPQRKILVDMVLQMVDVGLAGIKDPQHEIRFKLWTRCHQDHQPDPWDKTTTPSPSLGDVSNTQTTPTDSPTTQPDNPSQPSGSSSPSDGGQKGKQKRQRK